MSIFNSSLRLLHHNHPRIALPIPTMYLAKRGFSSIPPSSSRVLVIEPGLVHIKGALTATQQTAVSSLFLNLAKRPERGIWRKVNEVLELNIEPYRGRMYEALDTMPYISKLAHETLANAAKEDSNLREVPLTHAIMLYYKTLKDSPRSGYIPWHKDNGKNDGETDAPVISYTLGDTCDFLICHEKPKISPSHPLSNPKNLAHRIVFESGDALIFGGPCRYIFHSVFSLQENTSPNLPFKGARINFTIRSTPELLGKEHLFASSELIKVRHQYRSQFFSLKG